MGLHDRAHHGRVYRGLDAQKHGLVKRNSRTTGNDIKLNIPDYLKAAARPADPAQVTATTSSAAASITLDLNKDEVDDDVVTSTAIVYQTLSADFTGSIAGYTTLSASTTASATSSQNSNEAAYESAKSAGQAGASTITSTVSPTSSASSTKTYTDTDDGSNNKSKFLNYPTTTAATSTYNVNAVGGTPISATRTATADISNTSTGMSSGAKAGLAIGILAMLGLAGALIFFCWRRRKNQNGHQELGNEKRGSTNSSIFGGAGVFNEKRSSAASVAPSVRSTRTASTAPRLSLRPVTQFLPNLGSNRNSSANALDAAAAMSEKPKSMWERRSQNTDNPFDDHHDEKSGENPFDEPEGRNSAANHSAKSSLGSEPTTPKSTKFGTASAVPVVAAATPAPAGPNNVHRVQLDFKPSMEDELELKSGQLVRMLHEYDDGWALCIRMDRSQQGVVPRTCLSKMPVKPRPNGPPGSSNGARPMTPTGPPGTVPRPLTPSGSAESKDEAASTVVPARKPVPGQAL